MRLTRDGYMHEEPSPDPRQPQGREFFYPVLLLGVVSSILFAGGHPALGAFVGGIAVLTLVIAALVVWLLRRQP
jgi:hypothetical protein